MKKNTIFSIVGMSLCLFFAFSFTSCEQSADGSPSGLLSREEVKKILPQYLSWAGDEYVLTLSKTNAAKLGISDAFYDEAVGDLAESNEMIKEILRSNPDCLLPHQQPLQSHLPIIKTRSEISGGYRWEVGGMATISGGGDVGTVVTAPSDSKAIMFASYNHALIGSGSITIKSGWDETQYASIWNALFWASDPYIYEFPIVPVGRLEISVQLSGGGYCNYFWGYK